MTEPEQTPPESTPPETPAQPAAEAAPAAGPDTNQWCMFIHLAVFAGYVVPFAGLVLPIVLWQMKKEDPVIDSHGKMVTNFLISMVIYFIICFVLTFVLIGLFLLPVLGIIGIVFPIIGGIKANSGELWEYPMIIKLIK